MALVHAFVPNRTDLRDVAARCACSPALWAAVATALLVYAYWVAPGFGLAETLGDTDDAVRLLTVRELLAGASFFDTTLSRIGAPDVLVSHWSRLIDAPLALAILLLRPLLGPEMAETAVRAAWPLLLFFALALVLARHAEREAPARGALIAMVLVFTCGFAIVQFKPGRIDHHNAQILCAVAGTLFLARSLNEARLGWTAGAFLGVGLAIGYEAIALTVPMLALGGLLYVLFPARFAGARNAALACTATLVLCLVATTAPGKLAGVHCDALSLNLVALSAAAASGLLLASRANLPLSLRLLIAGGCAAAGAAIYAGLEPKCLAGPFGQVDPALKPMWLDHVLETQSLVAFARKHPQAGLPQIMFLLLGAATHLYLVWRRRDLATGFAAAGTLLAVALGFWQIKLTPYASWLVIAPMTAFATGLNGTGSVSPNIIRAFAVLMLSQATLSSLVSLFITPVPAATVASEAPTSNSCYRTDAVSLLSRLEPGLVAAELDLSAYVAALTPHRVVAAPYHRIDKDIVALLDILTGPQNKALNALQARGVTYVALCSATAASATPGTLRHDLLAGNPSPAFQEIQLETGALRIWRLR